MKSGTLLAEIKKYLPFSSGGGILIARKFQYDFAVDGGVAGAITLRAVDGLGPLPTKFIVQNAIIDMITALTSGGAATVSLTTGEGAADLQAATLVSNPPWSTLGLAATTVILGTLATQIKLTAQRSPSITIAIADLTAGKVNVFIQGVQSD